MLVPKKAAHELQGHDCVVQPEACAWFAAIYFTPHTAKKNPPSRLRLNDRCTAGGVGQWHALVVFSWEGWCYLALEVVLMLMHMHTATRPPFRRDGCAGRGIHGQTRVWTSFICLHGGGLGAAHGRSGFAKMRAFVSSAPCRRWRFIGAPAFYDHQLLLGVAFV